MLVMLNIDYRDPLFLAISGGVAILIILDIYFLYSLLVFRRKLSILMSGKKTKNLEDIVLGMLQKSKKQEVDILRLFTDVKELQGISEITIKKTAVLRFNPFVGMGGNQSFAIALLDSKNNGFVISSLFIKEGTRIYAKEVKKGKSDYALSAEEEEVLKKAMKSNDR